MSLRRIGVLCLFIIINLGLCYSQNHDNDHYDKKKQDREEQRRDKFITNYMSESIILHNTINRDKQTPKAVSIFLVTKNKLRDNVLATKEEE